MMDLSLVLFIFFFALTWYLLIKDVILRSKSEYFAVLNYPGAKILPMVGGMFQMLFMNDEEIFQFLRDQAKKHNQSWRQLVFNLVILNATRVREVEKILSSTKHVNKSLVYHFVKPFVGEGLGTSKGAKWQARRKILTPAFHNDILQQFITIFQEESDKMVQKLEIEVDKVEGTNVLPICTQFAMNSICETAMGVKLDTIDEGSEYHKKLDVLGTFFIYRLLRPWLHHDSLYKLSSHKKALDKVLEPIHQFTRNIINQRRDQFNKDALENNNNVATCENKYGTKKRRYAMLDTLLAAERDGLIDDEGIREEVDTFMFAGHDTITYALVYTFLLLAHNRDIQDQVVEEAKQVLAESGSKEILSKDFVSLKLMDRVMKESLRLYPPGSFISRVLGEDLIIDNMVFKKSSTAHIHVYDLHRDPEVFPDPEKFDPDRFLPENSIKRHPYAYIPFSAGPRNCVGIKFAILEMKSIITKVLLKYELHPITTREEIVFIADGILRSKDPIQIRFKQRH